MADRQPPERATPRDMRGITPAPQIDESILRNESLEEITARLAPQASETPQAENLDIHSLDDNRKKPPHQFTKREVVEGALGITAGLVVINAVTRYQDILSSLSGIGDQLDKIRTANEWRDIEKKYAVVLQPDLQADSNPWNLDRLKRLHDILTTLPKPIVNPVPDKGARVIKYVTGKYDTLVSSSDSTIFVSRQTFSKPANAALQEIAYQAVFWSLGSLQEPHVPDWNPEYRFGASHEQGWEEVFGYQLAGKPLDSQGKLMVPEVKKKPIDRGYGSYDALYSEFIKEAIGNLAYRQRALLDSAVGQSGFESLSASDQERYSFYENMWGSYTGVDATLMSELASYYVLGENQFRTLLGTLLSKEAVDGIVTFMQSLFMENGRTVAYEKPFKRK